MPYPTPSILITDDDRGFREALREVFEPKGFHIRQAGDGRQALEIVYREPIHLVILDMHMPHLTGLETIQHVKRFKSMLPCILITSDIDEAVIRQPERIEAYCVLSKPVSGRQVMQSVCDALRSTYNWASGDSTTPL
jgi:DNA-binding NtrC family response regulator